MERYKPIPKIETVTKKNDTNALDCLLNFHLTFHLEKASYVKYSIFRAQRRLIDPILGKKVNFVIKNVKSNERF